MRLILPVLLVLAALLGPRSAHAQFVPLRAADPGTDARGMGTADAAPLALSVYVLPAPGPADDAPVDRGRSDPWLVAGGVVGGGVGLFGGLVVGALLDGPADPQCRDMCFGPGLILGALAGEALGVALGVHLVNGRHGSLPLGFLTTAGVLTAGILAGEVMSPMILLAIPVGQLAGAIKVERATSRRR